MDAAISRRRALALLGAGGAVPASWLSAAPQASPCGPALDMHVHLFATKAGGSYLSPEQKRHVNYRYFLALLRLHEGPRMDEEYVERLVAQVRGSSVKRVVLVAQDCRYDGGRPDLGRTSFFVPNDYLFEVVARHPDVFVPCVSINPRRADAVEELERCAAKGARVLKIHPPIQDVDPGDPAFRRFYRRCSEDFFPGLVETVRRHPRLYCDTSNLASMLRWRNLPRALAVREVRERLVYGSDFPFPANALVFWSRLRPRTTLRLLSLRNLVERCYRLQLALGLPQEALTRGATLIGA